MTTLLLCNIGNSDLTVDGSQQSPRPARIVGKTLWNAYAEHAFDIPIIRPYLEYFKQKRIQIDRCVLFDTDQSRHGAAMNKGRDGVILRDKDTLWFGAIIERLLNQHWSDVVPIVERRTLTRINPSLYDEAMEAYGKELHDLDQGTISRCYVLTAGGIQACNTALLLRAISRFGERCEALYQPEGGSPYKLRVGQQVLATFELATVVELIRKQDFAGALALLPHNAPAGLRELVQYAADREAFDFERAVLSLERAEQQASGVIREFARSLAGSLDDLLGRGSLKSLMMELAANATIAFNNRRYTDFLGRMFRFQESTLRYMVEMIYGISTDMAKDKRAQNSPIFQATIHDNPELLELMQRSKIGNQPLRFDDPNIPTLTKMLEYAVDGGVRADGSSYLNEKKRGLYKEVLGRIAQFGKLSQLRNDSIIAHGFQGVSYEKITMLYGQGNPLEDIHTILKMLRLHNADALVFDTISSFVIEQLRSVA